MRKKIRHYLTVDQVREVLSEYFYMFKDEVIQDLLEKTDCKDLDELLKVESNLGFGFDCGWVFLQTKNDAQYHEWQLNDKYGVYVNRIPFPYNTQSTYCKQIQLDKAIKDLNLYDYYSVVVKLD